MEGLEGFSTHQSFGSLSRTSVRRPSHRGSEPNVEDDEDKPRSYDALLHMAPVKPFIAVSYVLFIFVHTSVLCQGLLLLISYSPSASDQWLLQLILLILVKLCTITTLSYLTFCNLTRRLTQTQLADWNLIFLAVVIPVANLNFFFNLPTFDVTMQSWPMFLIFLIALGVCAAELPTTHTIILWLMAAPIMMFLDFKKHVAGIEKSCSTEGRSDSSGLRGSCNSITFFSYILHSGMFLILMGPLSALLSFVLCRSFYASTATTTSTTSSTPARQPSSIKAVSEGRKWMSKPDQHSVQPAVLPGGSTNLVVEPLNSEAGDPHFQHHDVSSYLAPSSLLPFETFGIYIVRRLGLAPLLLYIDTQLQALMNIIPHRWSVLLVCAPLGALYLLRILVGRVNKNSSMSIRYISDEEWLLVLMVFFLLGRESYKMDTGPLLHSFRSRLCASQAILSDMLPSHIVDQMMHNLSSTHQPLAPATSSSDCTCPALVNDVASPISAQNSNTASPTASNVPLTKELFAEGSQHSATMMECLIAEHPELDAHIDSPALCSRQNSIVAHHAPVVQKPLHDDPVTMSRSQSFMNLNTTAPSALATARVSSGRARRSSLLFEHLEHSAFSFAAGASARIKDYALFVAAPSSGSASKALRHSNTSNSLVADCTAYPAAADASSGSPQACQPSSLMALSMQHKNVSESHECVTVFFSDIVGFSSWAHTVPALNVMKTLDDLFTRLDNIIMQEMPSLYKVETIGDAYMVASNLVVRDVQHAATMVRFALRVQEEASKVPRPDVEDGSMLQMRIGIHSGPVVSGIVGKLRRRFCLFGDTVNMASRTETSCPSGSIQLTQACYDLAAPYLSEFEVAIESRGPVEVKGAALPVRMYLASAAEQFLL